MKIYSELNSNVQQIHSVATAMADAPVSTETARTARSGASMKRFVAENPSIDLPPTEIRPGEMEFFQANQDLANARMQIIDNPNPICPSPLDPETLEKNRALKAAMLKAALAEIDAAIQKCPGQFLYHKLRAEILLEMKRYPEAMNEISYCIDHFDASGSSWEIGGISQGPQGDTNVWQFQYQWNKADAYWLRYCIYRAMGQKDSPEAISDLHTADEMGSQIAHLQILYPDVVFN